MFQTRTTVPYVGIRPQMNGQFVPQSIDVVGKVAQQKNLRHELQLLGGQIENIAFIRQ